MPLGYWVAFLVFLTCALLVDLLATRSRPEMSTREAGAWSALWVTIGLGFAGFVGWHSGGHAAAEYVAAYLIELSLSVDNLFVFAILFSYFDVPDRHRRGVLFWGIFGAILTRLAFILVGAALLQAFHPTIYVFGAFLLFTSWKMLRAHGAKVEPERNPVLRLLRSVLPITDSYRGAAFVVREGGRWIATPLLVVLVLVETTDIVFAVDSVPAVFAVTRDRFIAFTSNALAVLGLRALYFLVMGAMGRLRYLDRGLAVVLGFVGIKMLISDLYHIPIWISLGAVVGILAIAVVVSLLVRGDRAVEGDDARLQVANGPSDARPEAAERAPATGERE
jgi:tellurite resistance protein TerC